MKKWSLLSVPLLALAGLTVWAQAPAGAPADRTGVVIREPVEQALIPTSTDATSSDAAASHGAGPMATPLATAKPTAPFLKSAPLSPASTESAPDEGYAGGDPGSVQHVQPTQITSPAVASDDGVSHVELDDNGGLVKSDNSGSGGSSDD